MESFEDEVEQGLGAPIRGWDFSWLQGRATEERPSWHYAELVARRVGAVPAAVDLQSGGGEMLAGLPALPRLLVATEGWPANLAVAAARLRPHGIHVVAADSDRAALPLRDASFDLVTSRHPITTWWEEIARILRPGGTYLSQQVGPHSVGELTEFLMGPQRAASRREPEQARVDAEAAGLDVVDLRHERLETVFYDIAGVVYFLRLVVWIVPGFTVEGYRERLRDLYRHIQAHGRFVAQAARFLIEARKPG